MLGIFLGCVYTSGYPECSYAAFGSVSTVRIELASCGSPRFPTPSVGGDDDEPDLYSNFHNVTSPCTAIVLTHRLEGVGRLKGFNFPGVRYKCR